MTVIFWFLSFCFIALLIVMATFPLWGERQNKRD